MRSRIKALLALTSLSSTGEAAPKETLSSFFEALPSLFRETLPSDPTNAEALGESLGIRHLLSVVGDAVTGALPSLLSTLLTLAGILVLFSVLSLLAGSLGTGTARLGEAALGITLVLLAYGRMEGCFLRASAYLSDLGSLAEVAAPVMTSLYLAGGNAASAAAGSGAMAALSLVLSRLCASALLPLLRIMLGFLLVSAIGEVKTEGMLTTLRSLYTTVLGFFSLLITASLSLGNIIGSARDSLALRGLRFAVGNMIPMVGSTVAGSLSTLGAGVALIRATAGIGCVAVILLTCLPILLELILARMMLSLLGTLGGLLGAAAAVKLLRGFRALLDLCLAAVAFSSLLFLLVAAIFAKCAPAMG